MDSTQAYNADLKRDLPRLRSLLFAPGSDEHMLRRALSSKADAVIADLEDAVAPHRKAEARTTVARVFSGPRTGMPLLVRINGAHTPHFADDLSFVTEIKPDAIVLPKASLSALQSLGAVGRPVLALIETAVGMRDVYEIASRPRVFALLLGGVDLAADIGLEPRRDGIELLVPRASIATASAAARLRGPFDVVHTHIRDQVSLEIEARMARSLGFRGKACIHPSQVEVVNEVFTPIASEIEWARRVIETAARGDTEGRGAVALEGEMIDVAVIRRAEDILRQIDDSLVPHDRPPESLD